MYEDGQIHLSLLPLTSTYTPETEPAPKRLYRTHISFMSAYQRRSTYHRSPPSTDAATHASRNNTDNFYMKMLQS